MSNVWIICKRELSGYFGTPIAYVFLAIFVFLGGIFAFYIGNFFEGGQADLQSFFQFHPWFYLFLIPALAMRLWAEERRAGTIELLFTLPVTMIQAVLGKFLAAWVFTALATGAHVSALDHRQLPRRPRQRRRARELPRQPAHGRSVSCHRLVHLRPDPQPGHRVRSERRGVPGIRAERISPGARVRGRDSPRQSSWTRCAPSASSPTSRPSARVCFRPATSSTSSLSSRSGCTSMRW